MNCPKCQNENPANAKFCNECGAALNLEEQPRKLSSTSEAERKRVTALFSDLTGYTAMTERLDPEEVKEIMGRIFDGVKAIVGKYDGFIEKFAGDGVLALFGVPMAHEDDPIRAIRAAREIHSLVETLSPRYETKVGHALTMHSGINTGLVVTADVNPEKGTHGVTGEAINVAARLSGLAEARDILVGPDTYKASHSYFTFQPLKPAKVKGKSEHISIYKVLPTKALSSQVGPNRQVSSEIVGRDMDLDKLQLQVMKVVNGDGSVVNVIGEAGIGKSRLIAELKKRDVMKRVTLLEGRAISIGKSLSFHPIIDLLKQWARIAEDDSEQAAFDKLEKAIRAVHSEETNEILPFVAILMGMKLTEKHAERVKGIEGEGLEKLILKNVRELVIKGSERRPSVIIMEDLHWADTSSIDLLESLYRLADEYRVAFINVFRPGYLDRDDRALAKFGELFPAYCVEIHIQPLDKNDSETLINNMLDIKGLPYSLKEQILGRAGGNPFFIEEVVRSLIDEGALVRRDSVFEVTDKIDHVVIPPTINDVLMARIDRLEERTRDLLKVASVIGRSFFDRIIKDVADFIEDMDERLIFLKDVQLIRDHTRMQELEYLFKHALAQEVAYESTLLEQRKTLHLKVAQSIERVFQEKLHEFYGMLAYHYAKGEDLEKAEEYMTRAGEEALRSSASSEALTHFREALRLYLDKFGSASDPEKLAVFEKNIALAYFNKGRYEEAAEYFDKVFERWGKRLPKSQVVRIAKLAYDWPILFLRLLFPSMGRKKSPDLRVNEFFDLAFKKDIALVHANPVKEFFEQIGEARETFKYDLEKLNIGAVFHLGTSTLFALTGFFRMGELHLGFAKTLMNDEKILDRLCYEMMKSYHDLFRGDWHEIWCDTTLCDTGIKEGLFWYVCAYMWSNGCVKTWQGDFNEAKDFLEYQSHMWGQYEYGLSRAIFHLQNTETLVLRRRLNEAQAEANSLASISRKMGYQTHELQSHGWRAVAQVLARDVEGARESLAQADHIRQNQIMWTPWHAGPYLLGRFMLDLQMLEDAMGGDSRSKVSKHVKTAMKSGKMAARNATKYAPLLTWSYRLIGYYYWLMDKQVKALKWWDKAIQEGERLGARPDLSRTYFEVGKRLLEPQSKHKELNGIDPKGYLEKAETLFREMNLERDLEDLDRLKAIHGF